MVYDGKIPPKRAKIALMVKKYIVLLKDMSITLEVIVKFSLLNLDFSFTFGSLTKLVFMQQFMTRQTLNGETNNVMFPAQWRQ